MLLGNFSVCKEESRYNALLGFVPLFLVYHKLSCTEVAPPIMLLGFETITLNMFNSIITIVHI